MEPELTKLTKAYEKRILALYTKVIEECVSLQKRVPLNYQDFFFFKNNPTVASAIDKIFKEMNYNVYGTIVEGVTSSWDLAVNKNTEIAKKVYGKSWDDLPKDIKQNVLSNNGRALQSFISRKEKGLELSDRVWRNTKQFQQELELALEVGIGDGKSAQSLVKEVKKYLNEPDKLFRRVRDKSGVLRLSQAAKAYHPGNGVYRSSYKNSIRLTRNEINFSYENSNYLKRQQSDYVVGIEIRVSPQHNPADDTGGISCLNLQGFYPKDFDWTYKWHVNCKCMSLHVLKTPDEISNDVDKLLAGENVENISVNQINSLPESYTQTLENNQAKWLKNKSIPRTFRNN